jgi:hypothetical protein
MSLTPSLGPLILPTSLNLGQTAFQITSPTSNSTGAFTYSSSNTNIIQIISNNQATIFNNGTVTITATQAAAKNFKSASVSATIDITTTLGQPNTTTNPNLNKFTYIVPGTTINPYPPTCNLTITNYNPVTNILPQDGNEWIYFKYEYNPKTVNNLSNRNGHYINGEIKLPGNIPFNYEKLSDSDVWVLYGGPGGKYGKGGGGGSGEIIMANIPAANIIDTNNKYFIYLEIDSIYKNYDPNDPAINTLFNYSNSVKLSRNYISNSGGNATNLDTGSGATLQTSYPDMTISYYSKSGERTSTLTAPRNIRFTADIPRSSSYYNVMQSDGTGIGTQYYQGKKGQDGNLGFVMIFYKVKPTRYSLTVNTPKSILNSKNFTLGTLGKLNNIKSTEPIMYYLNNNIKQSVEYSIANNINDLGISTNGSFSESSKSVYYKVTKQNIDIFLSLTDNNGYLLDKDNINYIIGTRYINYKINNNFINIIYVIDGGNGANWKYGTGGGGGGGCSGLTFISSIKLTNGYKLKFNLKNSTTNYVSFINTNNQETTIMQPGKYSLIDPKPPTNLDGGDGANGMDIYNINSKPNNNYTVYGIAPGGGGGGYTKKGNSGDHGIIPNTARNISYISNSSRSPGIVTVNNIITSYGGSGGSGKKNGSSGSDGFILIYFQVV